MALGLAGAGAVGTMLAPSAEPSYDKHEPISTSQSWGHWYPFMFRIFWIMLGELVST